MKKIPLILATLMVALGVGGIAAPAAAAATGSYSYQAPTYRQGTGARVGSVTVTESFVPSLRVGGTCTLFTFCLWTSTNYTGTKKEINWVGDGNCFNLSGVYDNNADSSYNKTDFWWTIWEGYNGTGSTALSHSPQNCVCGGWGFPDLNAVSGYARNITSSYCGGA